MISAEVIKTDRIILHCDCNSFFASVEELMNPSLRSVPMAVAGDPENRHGIILAKNQLAKKYNIRTAEPIWQAKQKCPGLVCVLPHHEKYSEISREINKIYLEYTDLVEPASIDESYLDVTGSIHLFSVSAHGLADMLRYRIRTEVGVTISAGVSFCKTFAKLGSDYKKPDATTEITRENLRDIVYPLPVSDMLMAGRKTTEALKKLGIVTIGQLAEFDSKKIEKILGKAGENLQNSARGFDTENVRSFYEPREVKSVGNSMTFRRDLKTEDEIREGIALLSDSVAGRLREEKKKCTVIQIGIKDPNFNTIQRQKTLPSATYLQKDISDCAMALVNSIWNGSSPVRLLSVTGAGLIGEDEDFVQLNMFSDEKHGGERQKKIEDTMAGLREKFGNDVIKFGYFRNDDTGIK